MSTSNIRSSSFTQTTAPLLTPDQQKRSQARERRLTVTSPAGSIDSRAASTAATEAAEQVAPPAATAGKLATVKAKVLRFGQPVSQFAVNADKLTLKLMGDHGHGANVQLDGVAGLACAASLANCISSASVLKDSAEAVKALEDYAANGGKAEGIAKQLATLDQRSQAKFDLVKSGVLLTKSALTIAGTASASVGKAVPFMGAAAGIVVCADFGRKIRADGKKADALNSANQLDGHEELKAAAEKLKDAAKGIRSDRKSRNWLGLTGKSLSVAIGITVGILGIIGTGGLALPILLGAGLLIGLGNFSLNMNRTGKAAVHTESVKAALGNLRSPGNGAVVKDQRVNTAYAALDQILTAAETGNTNAQEFLKTAARLDSNSTEAKVINKLLETVTKEGDPAARRELLEALGKRIV